MQQGIDHFIMADTLPLAQRMGGLGSVTLRYGLTSSRELWDWLQSAAQGRVERKNVSILMLDSQGTSEVMRWNLIDAWPSEWHSASLDALSREVAIESMTLVYDTLERA